MAAKTEHEPDNRFFGMKRFLQNVTTATWRA